MKIAAGALYVDFSLTLPFMGAVEKLCERGCVDRVKAMALVPFAAIACPIVDALANTTLTVGKISLLLAPCIFGVASKLNSESPRRELLRQIAFHVIRSLASVVFVLYSTVSLPIVIANPLFAAASHAFIVPAYDSPKAPDEPSIPQASKADQILSSQPLITPDSPIKPLTQNEQQNIQTIQPCLDPQPTITNGAPTTPASESGQSNPTIGTFNSPQSSNRKGVSFKNDDARSAPNPIIPLSNKAAARQVKNASSFLNSIKGRASSNSKQNALT